MRTYFPGEVGWGCYCSYCPENRDSERFVDLPKVTQRQSQDLSARRWPLLPSTCSEPSAVPVTVCASLLNFTEPKCLGSRSTFFLGTTLPPKDKDGKPGGFQCSSKIFLCGEVCQPSANTTYSELWVWTNEGHSSCPGGMQAPGEARPATLRGERERGQSVSPKGLSFLP